MTSMTATTATVTIGVDTHRDVHHAAVINDRGQRLADAGFTATEHGYRELARWAESHGTITAFGVEGTGSYGAGLTRYLRAQGHAVIEVDRPNRRTRARTGKSDSIDAYAAAGAVLSGTATGVPKTRDGLAEAIRPLHLARRSAVKARTQTINQLRAVLLTAPAALRTTLAGLSTRALLHACARLRPAPGPISATADPVLAATKTVLRRLARRNAALTAEIDELDRELNELVSLAAPTLIALPGVGTDVAAQLMITAGDNPDRISTESNFAHLCGVAPLPASSGRTTRHRLNRGGDRQANRALHVIALSRLSHHKPTRAYAERRTTEGRTGREIMRCLKRYIAREIHHVLTVDKT